MWQDKEIKTLSDITITFNKIRKNLFKMRKSKIELETILANKAKANIYTLHNSISLIDLLIYKELKNIKEEYYFSNQKLFFIFSNEIELNAPFSSLFFDENRIKTSKNSYFFIDNKMVRWISNRKIDIKEYKTKENQLLSFAKFLLKKAQ